PIEPELVSETSSTNRTPNRLGIVTSSKDRGPTLILWAPEQKDLLETGCGGRVWTPVDGDSAVTTTNPSGVRCGCSPAPSVEIPLARELDAPRRTTNKNLRSSLFTGTSGTSYRIPLSRYVK
ncbi:hypothetical protein BHM03_00049886, partial [Ensete ventricosum]